ncbi:alpha/beta hydrolase [Actinoplanes sp. NPDC051346]|uniref:alpha/beta fold hydrolase n=1 Tax=Actinoplanes sp. NPDC051346 TaxID=3155048 RepID=UPI0034232349
MTPRTVVESPDGVPLALFSGGSGPSVLLVHGTGEDHQRWRVTTTALADEFTVHALDRRGRGASGDAPAYGWRAEAADLVAVMRHLGDRTVLIAHSYGAICALEAAAQLPSLGGLVLYEPPIPVTTAPAASEVAARIGAAVAAGDPEEGLCLFLTDVIGLPPAQVNLLRRVPGFRERAEVARTIPREIEQTANYVLDAGHLAAIQAPTLVISGECSPEDLRRAAQRVASAVPGAHLRSLPGQAHLGMDTAPQLFADVVRTFLHGVVSQSSPNR